MKKTIAHEFLDIEAEGFEVPQSCYNMLESIIEKSKEKINTQAKPEKIMLSIGKLLKKEGFSHKNGISLTNGLQMKKTNCKVSSLLYSAIAETLQLPLSIIRCPHHMAIRWNDGKDVFNWETTNRKKVDDEYYISFFKIAEKSASKGVYLKDMTREEIKAVAFDERGSEKAEDGKFDEALLDYTKAIELCPNFADAYYNRGTAKQELNDVEGAISDYDKAIELNPNHSASYDNRGTIKRKKGLLEEAIDDYNESIELDPSNAVAYNNRAIAKEQKGLLEEAISDLDKAIKLDSNNADVYNNRGIVKELKGDFKGAKKDFKKQQKLESRYSYNKHKDYQII